MTSVIYLLINVAGYTICTVNDKKSISHGQLSSSEFTFFLSFATVVFMLPCIPFLGLSITLCPQTFVIIALLTLDKLAEFFTSAACLRLLSAFEVKAWLGLSLFLSYASDCVFFGEKVSLVKALCLPMVFVGLMLIASDGSSIRDKLSPKLLATLALYIISKYAYGLIMRAGEPYLSKNTGLLSAMVLLTLIMLFAIIPKRKEKGILNSLYAQSERDCSYSEYKHALLIVFLTRIPNIVGLLSENALIGISLTLYSFVQPLILVVLFMIGVIKREHFTSKNLVGSVMCIAFIFLFQAA